MNTLEHAMQRIGPLDEAAMAAARARQQRLTKPPGSLGRLEELSIQLAGITGNPRPRVERRAVVVMAGDHGVVAEGVSAYPAEVTPQMVLNFLRGGAAINVLARQASARVVVVDLGVRVDLADCPGLIRRKVAYGTRNLSLGPAMSREEAIEAIGVGVEVVGDEARRGLDLVATGDMGIGNTTAASAIVAAITGAPVAAVTGRGTGVDDAGLSRKIAAIERGLAVNQPDRRDPIDVLHKVGGLEIAGLVGVILAAAGRRLPVVVDGFISGAAALVAAEFCPPARDYLIAAHSSVEIGHRIILERLELAPLLNLSLRLGEGTGAALAMGIVEAAARILDEMATFDEAGVSGRTNDERRTTNDERRTTNDERRTTNDGRRTTDDERRTTDDGRRTTDDGRPARDQQPATGDRQVSAIDESGDQSTVVGRRSSVVRRPSLIERLALPPEAIEAKSYTILDQLLPPLDCEAGGREVVRRIAYANGDATLASLVRLHPAAVPSGLAAIRRGAPIVVDVQMVASGINRALAGRLGCSICCAIDEPAVIKEARETGVTRAIAAMRHLAPAMDGAIVAIGNAPTALLAVLDLVDAGTVRPALIVGTPVGYVAAAESKAELVQRAVPYVTIAGTRGGSSSAAAAVNALLKMAAGGERAQ